MLNCHSGLQRRVSGVDVLLPVLAGRRIPCHRPRSLQGRHRRRGVRLLRHLVPPHLGQGRWLDAGHAGKVIYFSLCSLTFKFVFFRVQ